LGVDFDSCTSSNPGLQQPPKQIKNKILGEPVSPGYYTGRVRIIKQIDSNMKLEPNDIIVTPSIDPGQTHVFLLAGALILEVGGLLSHGAILAREFGLPTVAQVRGATQRLKDAQVVTVNGNTGEIFINDSTNENVVQ
jgi:pyruvate,water dikinase